MRNDLVIDPEGWRHERNALPRCNEPRFLHVARDFFPERLTGRIGQHIAYLAVWLTCALCDYGLPILIHESLQCLPPGVWRTHC